MLSGSPANAATPARPRRHPGTGNPACVHRRGPPATLETIIARATDASLAANTRRSYRAAWRLWQAWACGRDGADPDSPTPATLCHYLAHRVASGVGVGALRRDPAALRWVCRNAGQPDPSMDPRIARQAAEAGVTPVQAAGLTRDAVMRIRGHLTAPQADASPARTRQANCIRIRIQCVRTGKPPRFGREPETGALSVAGPGIRWRSGWSTCALAFSTPLGGCALVFRVEGSATCWRFGRPPSTGTRSRGRPSAGPAIRIPTGRSRGRWRLLADAGEACSRHHDETVTGLPGRRHLQCDELWSYIYAKEKNAAHVNPWDDAGTVWTWIALDTKSKLVVSCRITKGRDTGSALKLMRDLKQRLLCVPDLAADEPQSCRKAVPHVFGRRCRLTQCKVDGTTSHVERCNLKVRMGNKRYTRRTSAFSKTFRQHVALMHVHTVYNNFCWQHASLRVSPAMEAGIDDTLRDPMWIVGLVDDNTPAPRKPGPKPGARNRKQRRKKT